MIKRTYPWGMWVFEFLTLYLQITRLLSVSAFDVRCEDQCEGVVVDRGVVRPHPLVITPRTHLFREREQRESCHILS